MGKCRLNLKSRPTFPPGDKGKLNGLRNQLGFVSSSSGDLDIYSSSSLQI